MPEPDVPPPSPPRAARGYTLIELMVVLALIALALSIAVPGWSAVHERQRLRGAAAELASDLQWMRSQALARNEALRLSLYQVDNGSCTVVHTGNRTDCRCERSGAAICDAGAEALKTSHWLTREKISVQANIASMAFDPAQGTVTPTGSIRIVDSRGLGITHVVNILGRIRSCSPSAAISGFQAC